MTAITNIEERIAQSTPQIFTPDTYPRFLSFASRFLSYSNQNILLLYLQSPELQYAAGIQAWRRLSMKGIPDNSVPILVLYPEFHPKEKAFRYSTRQVFDCPNPKILSEHLTSPGLNEFYRNGKLYSSFVFYLKNETGKSIYPSADDDQTEVEECGSAIMVPFQFPNTQKFRLLLTYYLRSLPEGKGSTPIEVCIIDSIRYLITVHYGIDEEELPAFPYLPVLDGHEEQQRAVLTNTLTVSKKSIQFLDSCYLEQFREQNPTIT